MGTFLSDLLKLSGLQNLQWNALPTEIVRPSEPSMKCTHSQLMDQKQSVKNKLKPAIYKRALSHVAEISYKIPLILEQWVASNPLD